MFNFVAVLLRCCRPCLELACVFNLNADIGVTAKRKQHYRSVINYYLVATIYHKVGYVNNSLFVSVVFGVMMCALP